MLKFKIKVKRAIIESNVQTGGGYPTYHRDLKGPKK